jgi:histone H3/H4
MDANTETTTTTTTTPGTKRHQQAAKKGRVGMTNGVVRRIALRSGVKRLGSSVYRPCKAELQHFLDQAVPRSAAFATHAKRHTLTSVDVVKALHSMGVFMVGYGATK